MPDQSSASERVQRVQRVSGFRVSDSGLQASLNPKP